MGARLPELAEPVIVDRFVANRRKDEIRTTLQSYQGVLLIDLRKFVVNREGITVPTSKGITVKVTRSRDLLKAMTKAVAKAEELGLIDGVGDENE